MYISSFPSVTVTSFPENIRDEGDLEDQRGILTQNFFWEADVKIEAIINILIDQINNPLWDFIEFLNLY